MLNQFERYLPAFTEVDKALMANVFRFGGFVFVYLE